ncbi:hypothetical protein OIU79_018246, partial [Salix purpurea]
MVTMMWEVLFSFRKFLLTKHFKRHTLIIFTNYLLDSGYPRYIYIYILI